MSSLRCVNGLFDGAVTLQFRRSLQHELLSCLEFLSYLRFFYSNNQVIFSCTLTYLLVSNAFIQLLMPFLFVTFCLNVFFAWMSFCLNDFFCLSVQIVKPFQSSNKKFFFTCFLNNKMNKDLSKKMLKLLKIIFRKYNNGLLICKYFQVFSLYTT